MPFFTYINFILGYVPLILGDFTSQLIISFYVIYTLLYKFFLKLIKLTNYNIINSANNYYSSKIDSSMHYTKSNTNSINSFFNNNLGPKSVKNIPIFSKNLSQLTFSLSNLNSKLFLAPSDYTNYNIPTNFDYNTLKLKPVINSLNSTFSRVSIASSESFYSDITFVDNRRVKTSSINLSELNKILNTKSYPLFFNFNLENNVNLAKQQRWLSRNSLLTESLTKNSFLITQAKKLIGFGTLDSNYTNNTL